MLTQTGEHFYFSGKVLSARDLIHHAVLLFSLNTENEACPLLLGHDQIDIVGIGIFTLEELKSRSAEVLIAFDRLSSGRVIREPHRPKIAVRRIN